MANISKALVSLVEREITDNSMYEEDFPDEEVTPSGEFDLCYFVVLGRSQVDLQSRRIKI